MRRHKYGAKKTVVDGHTFPSKAEARRYSELKLLERAGEIRQIELQPKFPLVINGVSCGRYTADFRFFRGDECVVEDVKGVRTEAYVLRKRIAEALYSIKITEISSHSPPPTKQQMAYLAQAPNLHFRQLPQDEIDRA